MKVNSAISNIDTLITEYVEEYNKGNNGFLLFDLAHANENSHTKVLLSLLKYNNSSFLPSFLERLGLPNSIEYKYNDIYISDQEVAISVKNSGKAKGFIDLYIKYKAENCKNVHVIIENKIYGAGDTKRQLARYIATIEGVKPIDFDKWYDKPEINSDIYVLYLTADGTKEPQKDSLPDIIKKCLGDKYIPINYQDNILPWLEEDVLPNIPFYKDGIMIAGIRQYIAYLYSMRQEKVSLLSDFYFQNVGGSDVEKYKRIQKDIETIEKKIGKGNKDTILQSLKRELSVKAESIFMNDVEGIEDDWRIHFTPSFICLYKQSWADLDTRKYSIPSIYFCGDQTRKFLDGKNPKWKLQIDHLGNNYKIFEEDNEIPELALGPVARFDICGRVKNLTIDVKNRETRKEYYKQVIDVFSDLIDKINNVVDAVKKNNDENFNLQVNLLRELIKRWSIK